MEAYNKQESDEQKQLLGVDRYAEDKWEELVDNYNRSTNGKYKKWAQSQFNLNEQKNIALYGKKKFLQFGCQEAEWNSKSAEEQKTYAQRQHRLAVVQAFKSDGHLQFNKFVQNKWRDLEELEKQPYVNQALRRLYTNYVWRTLSSVNTSSLHGLILNPMPNIPGVEVMKRFLDKEQDRQYVVWDLVDQSIKKLQKLPPVDESFNKRLKELQGATGEANEKKRIQLVEDYNKMARAYAHVQRIKAWYESSKATLGSRGQALGEVLEEKNQSLSDWSEWRTQHGEQFRSQLSALESKFVQNQKTQTPYQMIERFIVPFDENGLKPWEDLFLVKSLTEDAIAGFLDLHKLGAERLGKILPGEKEAVGSTPEERSKNHARAVHDALKAYAKAFKHERVEQKGFYQVFLDLISEPGDSSQQFARISRAASGLFYALQWTFVRYAYFKETPTRFALGAVLGALEVALNGKELQTTEPIERLLNKIPIPGGLRSICDFVVDNLVGYLGISTTPTDILGGRSLWVRSRNFGTRTFIAKCSTLCSELNLLSMSIDLLRGPLAGRDTFHALWSTVRN